jgi:hypothetical protein
VGTEYAVTTGRFQEAKSQAAFRQSILEGDGRIGAHNGRRGLPIAASKGLPVNPMVFKIGHQAGSLSLLKTYRCT